ncbi:hypothetical protein N7537_004465 [Penicillium hordei]|uniref:Uncharacterized protein n=1 Tax=Penicillium hordei TaxID=40994 RepID=A0AAD6EBE0_9EURO|nr:uncharacterized protein N7537_004465 [Penicillium hordei]KAJ5607846.1 hypothetical protein N7537_004465 [Penicillium hordei]
MTDLEVLYLALMGREISEGLVKNARVSGHTEDAKPTAFAQSDLPCAWGRYSPGFSAPLRGPSGRKQSENEEKMENNAEALHGS